MIELIGWKSYAFSIVLVVIWSSTWWGGAAEQCLLLSVDHIGLHQYVLHVRVGHQDGLGPAR